MKETVKRESRGQRSAGRKAKGSEGLLKLLKSS